jgi:hypothetical protein
MHEVAQHLSAMGRKGDSMLVHMSPQEVSAMNGIAALHGTNLGRNPDTGLPEAFNLGGFFKSLLPTLAGAAATTLTGGALAPVLAGMATGAVLNKGALAPTLMGGLTGLAAGNLGQAFNASGAASAVPQGGAGISAAGGNSLATPTVSTAMESGSVIPGADAMSSASAMGKLTSFMPDAGASNVVSSQAPTTFGQMGQGIANLGNSAGRDAFVKSLGGTGPNADLIAAGKVAMPLGMAALSGIEPPKLPEEEKYDPNFQLNLSGDSGLRFFAEGGDITEMPDPGSNPLQNAQDAFSYGIGGLSYAQGGDVQNFASGGYTLKDNSGNVIERGNGGLGAMINAIKNNQDMFGGNKNQGLFGGQGLNLNAADAPRPNPLSFMDAFINRQQYQRPQYQRPTQASALPFYNMLNRTTQPVQAPPPGLFGGSSKALFAKGGYLDGPGDGMSDSIPATIEGKQPARLADGEFVVPADVVSHIGNGSTKAGAQRLYDMMAKVRKARTGTTKQGKQINPKKYLPA